MDIFILYDNLKLCYTRCILYFLILHWRLKHTSLNFKCLICSRSIFHNVSFHSKRCWNIYQCVWSFDLMQYYSFNKYPKSHPHCPISWIISFFSKPITSPIFQFWREYINFCREFHQCQLTFKKWDIITHNPSHLWRGRELFPCECHIEQCTRCKEVNMEASTHWDR